MLCYIPTLRQCNRHTRVRINLSKLHGEKFKWNFTPFTFTWMHPWLCLRVKNFSYHVDCWKMHFPHWIKVSSQKIFFEWQKLNASNENFVSAATIVANLIFLANARTPGLRMYHIRISLLVTFVVSFTERELLMQGLRCMLTKHEKASLHIIGLKGGSVA